jgi:hypothetical protein
MVIAGHDNHVPVVEPNGIAIVVVWAVFWRPEHLHLTSAGAGNPSPAPAGELSVRTTRCLAQNDRVPLGKLNGGPIVVGQTAPAMFMSVFCVGPSRGKDP